MLPTPNGAPGADSIGQELLTFFINVGETFAKRAKMVFMGWLLKIHTWLSEGDPAAFFGRLDRLRR